MTRGCRKSPWKPNPGLQQELKQNTHLDESQRSAIISIMDRTTTEVCCVPLVGRNRSSSALELKQVPAIVFGPFGAGKTYTLTELVLQVADTPTFSLS